MNHRLFLRLLAGLFLFPSLFLFSQNSGAYVLPDSLYSMTPQELFAHVDTFKKDHSGEPYQLITLNSFALEVAEKNREWAMASHFASQISRSYNQIGLLESSLIYSLKARAHAKKTEGLFDDIWALYRLTSVHSRQNQVESALQDAHEALDLAIERDTLKEIGLAHNQIGEVYRRSGQFDSAKVHYEKGLQTLSGADYQYGIDIMGHNLAITLAEMGDYERADSLLNRELLASFEADVDRIMEEGMARVRMAEEREGKAIAIAICDSFARKARIEKLVGWEIAFLERSAGLQREMETWDAAWENNRRKDSLKESLAGEKAKIQTQLLEDQSEIAAMNAQRNLLLEKQANDRTTNIAVAAIAALLLVIAILLIVSMRRTRKTNHMLAEKNAQLDDFLSEKDTWINLMAHDLKAPLNSIQGLLRIAQSPDTPDQVREEVFGHISKAVGRGTDLIGKLLELSQIESGNYRVQAQEVNLGKLVLEAKEAFQTTAAAKDIQIEAEIPQEAIEIKTDPAIVSRILENLLSNAIKFSPPGKKVSLSLFSSELANTISITDQGPGLSSEDQKNLFKKFTKLSARPTGGESSNGLGLSIVKGLAEKLGADITVESPPGKGATFHLIFPS